MKRQLLTLVLAGLVGSFALASDAKACHKKKCSGPSTCTTTVVAYSAPAPCAPPAPTCAPAKKKCGLFAFKGIGMGHGHKKAACAGPVVTPCETVAYSAPVTYGAPVYSSPQGSAQH